VTGVVTNISDRSPSMDSRWGQTDVQGFLAKALQNIYNQVVEAKDPFLMAP